MIPTITQILWEGHLQVPASTPTPPPQRLGRAQHHCSHGYRYSLLPRAVKIPQRIPTPQDLVEGEEVDEDHVGENSTISVLGHHLTRHCSQDPDLAGVQGDEDGEEEEEEVQDISHRNVLDQPHWHLVHLYCAVFDGAVKDVQVAWYTKDERQVTPAHV